MKDHIICVSIYETEKLSQKYFDPLPIIKLLSDRAETGIDIS